MTTRKETPRLPDVDARAIVPITDEIGGVVIYAAGRPAYYVLNGEWFEALPEPRTPARKPAAAKRSQAKGRGASFPDFAYPNEHGR